MTQRPIGCIQQKRKAQDGLHNSICTRFAPTPPLEVRNAELYEYRCPNAPWYTGYDTIACVLLCFSRFGKSEFTGTGIRKPHMV